MEQSLVKRIAGFSLVSVISAILSMVLVPVSTHIYDANILGKINFFFAVVTIVWTLFCLGLDQGYVRFFSLADGPSQQKRLLTFSMSVSLIVLTCSALLALLFNDTISIAMFGEVGTPVCAWLYSIVACMLILRFISLKYRMLESILGYTLYAAGVSIVQKVLYILSAIVNTDYWTAIGFVSVACIPIMVVSIIHERKSFFKPNIELEKELYLDEIRFAIPLFVSSSVAILTNYVPQFTIRGFLEFRDISIFTAALTVSLAINLIQSGFNTFWAPYVYKNYQTQQSQIHRAHEGVVIVATLACMLLAIVADPVFMLFKAEYAQGACLVPFLTLAPMCYTIGETTGVGIAIMKKTKYSAFIAITVLLSSAVFSLILTPLMGLAGAAIAVGAAALINLVLKTLIGERFYQSISSQTFMIRGLLPYICVCIVAVIFREPSILKYALEFICLLIACVLFGRERLVWVTQKLSGLVRK